MILCCVLCKRTEIVPDVHLSAERADLDDGLAQEIVRFTFEMLLHPRLDVIVLVPHAHLDAVGGVVTFAASAQEIKVGSDWQLKNQRLTDHQVQKEGNPIWRRKISVRWWDRAWGGTVRLKGAVGL